MPAPLVSICIPTYNYRQYLPDALESALEQTARDIEILIVDNCSEDGTTELLEEFARRDGRVVCHRNPKNLGMMANFNRCIALARGKYVKFLCADDVLTADCVERMAAAIEERPDIRLAGCGRHYFRDRGKPLKTLAYASRRMAVPGTTVIKNCFFKGNLIGEPTAVLFRKAEVGTGFNQSYRQAFDMELWFRLLAQGWFVFLGEPLCGIREHRSSGTADNLRAGKVTEDKVRLFEEYAHQPYLRGSLIERLRWDGRMASSVAREAAAGSTLIGENVLRAVYHPALFRFATLPLVTAITALRS
ncbi:MAG TPA: glycosyltransferase family A protein [Bradyrhizobium sp.]|nr:glycosyltransferase family A protein [Bradyrhizobium sp.]